MKDSKSLDPDDWDDFRKLAYRAVDVMVDRLRSIEQGPAWQAMPEDVEHRLRTSELPRSGIGEAAALDAFCRDVLPYPNGSWHPRFLGWVQGSGLPFGMLADMLASGMNAHLSGFNQAPKWVELQVIRWVAEMLGWPSNSGGLLTTGATMANTLALAVARQCKATWNVRQCGTRPAESAQMVVYCSDQTHGWIDKAVELLGLGSDGLRKIVSDADGRIDLEALKSAIDDDRRLGRLPICIIGNVGTVHFGAIDDLQALHQLCLKENLWFHIDGAFGALAYLLDEYRPTLTGIELADSLAIDLHKWMYLPFDIGLILIRSEQAQLDTFATTQSYMTTTDRGLLAGGVPLADRGIELTRSFRALKAWMCFQAYGIDRFAECIRANIAQAKYLARLIEQNPNLELLAPVPLNIVCFRFLVGGLSEKELNDFNREVLLSLQESGEAVLSSTMLGGIFALRAAITNHRTRFCDLDRIVASIVKIAQDRLKTKS